MAKNDLVLLDGILDDYVARGIIPADSGEAFEYFATEQILKDYALSKEQLLSGSVDGRNDGGIDEFFILVNGHLAENILEGHWPRSHASLDVYIISCKHDDSFKQTPINALVSSLIQLLDFSIPSSALVETYNEAVLRKRELLSQSYRRVAPALAQFDIHVIYASRGDEAAANEPNISEKARQVEDICRGSFTDCSAEFSFWGSSKLLTKYRENKKSSLDLLYEECINQQGQYVVLASLKNYHKFISTEKGDLNRHLFDANVRDFLGLNAVNTDIFNSLKRQDGPDFWWLNNGVTIIGSNARIIGKQITIENAKIVNGLQTSESIYNYFTSSPDVSDSRHILIKILLSEDPNTCNAIIYAANNQTNVNTTALRATDKVQYDIEAILKAHGIYYERRTNYYQNQGIPKDQIVTPLSLASGYICLIYKNPYIATSLKQRFMRDDRKYLQVFSPQIDINVWVAIAEIISKADEHLVNIRAQIERKAKTFKFLKNYRQMVMFITISRLLDGFSFDERKLCSFDRRLITEAEIRKTLEDLDEVCPGCFGNPQKLKPQLYYACYRHVAAKYNLKDIKSIRACNKKLWPEVESLESGGLSPDIVEKVYLKLPPQPWASYIHQQIANDLGLREFTVSSAISYLMYSGKVNYQFYGYVFDAAGTVVSECNHYGHTEREARKKMAEQISCWESKFGF